MKRLSKCSFILALVMTLVSCGTAANGTESTSSAAGDTDDPETTAGPDLYYGLGEHDFDGKEFGIVTCKNYFFSPYDPETENGEILNDAAYKRNRNIEERFNCQITYTMLDGSAGEAADAIRQTVMVNDAEYQLGIVHPYMGLRGLITGSLVLDWNKIDSIDFSNPWWNKSFNETLAIKDILPCASSDFIYFNSGCVYFNKELAEKYEITDPYKLVYDGGWTWDKLAEISAEVALDIDGNDVMDSSDQYGYSIINNHRVIPVTYSYGMFPSSRDDDGYITLKNLGSEKMHTIVENYRAFLFDSGSAFLPKSDELVPFRNGQVLFLHYVTQNIVALRDLNWDFGILPMPKYDENQENYYSLAQSNVMVIPATETDTEFVGTIIEALSAESHLNVLPALYDTTFNNKYLRDEDSIKMFDIIKNSLVYDPVWNYCPKGDIAYFLSNLLAKNSSDTVSFYASKHEAAEADLREFFDEVSAAYETN